MAGTKVDQVYIGTCTNGRIEDLRQAAAVLKGRMVADSVRGIVSPATPKIFQEALAEGEVCAATSNRNFSGRMGKGGMVHLMSPSTAAATAITGVITDARSF